MTCIPRRMRYEIGHGRQNPDTHLHIAAMPTGEIGDEAPRRIRHLHRPGEDACSWMAFSRAFSNWSEISASTVSRWSEGATERGQVPGRREGVGLDARVAVGETMEGLDIAIVAIADQEIDLSVHIASIISAIFESNAKELASDGSQYRGKGALSALRCMMWRRKACSVWGKADLVRVPTNTRRTGYARGAWASR